MINRVLDVVFKAAKDPIQAVRTAACRTIGTLLTLPLFAVVIIISTGREDLEYFSLWKEPTVMNAHGCLTVPECYFFSSTRLLGRKLCLAGN